MPEPLPNPLLPLHQQTQAEFQAYGPLQIVSTFGQPQVEYAALRRACALFDMPHRGILELTGRDRLSFLNNLLSNQTWDKSTKTGLLPGQGVYSFFLNNKGRIVADMNVLEQGDRTLLELDARMVEPLRLALDKYLFVEQVKMASRLGSLHQFALHGPGVKPLLDSLLPAPLPDLSTLGSSPVRILDLDAIVWRDDPTGAPGYHLIVPLDAAGRLWTELAGRFGDSPEPGKRTLRPIGWAAFNTARIEAGRPLFGIDFDVSVLPAETAQLPRAVSFTKGCYLGQEIVARMQARNQLARQLVGIKMESDALPIAGAKIYDDNQQEIGGVTSSTPSPLLSNTAICLGYVRRLYTTPGATLHLPAEGAVRTGTVVQLPFV